MFSTNPKNTNHEHRLTRRVTLPDSSHPVFQNRQEFSQWLDQQLEQLERRFRRFKSLSSRSVHLAGRQKGE